MKLAGILLLAVAGIYAPVQVSETKTDDRRIREEVVDLSDAWDRLRQQIAGVDEALNKPPGEPKDPNG
jgi:hypothetical protein